MSRSAPRVGVVLGSHLAPEQIPPAARAAEGLGFSSTWLTEDYFFTGGISAAAAVLSATERMHAGLGIVSAVTRHPALLAMEIATLDRMFPGRVRPAIGLGMPKWMIQMGLNPPSSIAALRSCVTALRVLLAGEEHTADDGPYSFDRIRLEHPILGPVPPLLMGVSGPEMLRLAGEIADGVLVSVMAGVDYLNWARERIAEGAETAGVDPDTRGMTVYAFMSVCDDGDASRAAVRHRLAFYLAGRPDGPVVRAYGISDELKKLAADGGAERVERDMPDQWVEDLAISGTPAECAAKIERLFDAGATEIGILPAPAAQATSIIEMAGEQVLPLLRDRAPQPPFDA